MPLGTLADVEARVGGAEACRRLFDRDRNGIIDSPIFAAADAYAEAQIYAILGASQPGKKFDDPGPVPVIVTDLWARLVAGYAGEMRPGAFVDRTTGRSPYGGMKASALADLKALADNNRMQLPTGAPAPFIDAVAGIVAPAPVWGQLAAGGGRYDPDRGAGGGFSGF